MCAWGPGPLRSRGAERGAALSGRSPAWRCRCPRCWSVAVPGAETLLRAAGRGGRGPRGCSRRSLLSPRSGRGRAPRERRGFASWRKRLLRGWHVSCVVLPVFLPPLPTPLFSCRCGFEGIFFSARPLPGQSWESAPAPSQGLPQSRRGKTAFLERAGLPAGCLEGRGAPLGASPSHVYPLLGVVSTTAPLLPCPGGDRFLPSLSLSGWPRRVRVCMCGRSGGGGGVDCKQQAK